MRRFLLAGFVVVATALSAYAAPITADLVVGTYYPQGDWDSATLVVNGPAGTETHYLDWRWALDGEKMLVSQTGRVVVSLDKNNWIPVYYDLRYLAGPGVYGDLQNISPEVDRITHSTRLEEFSEYELSRRPGWLAFNVGMLVISRLESMDKYGNVYGYNVYSSAWGADANDVGVVIDTLVVPWKNFSPYPIPEPSTVVLMSFGLGALALRRRFVNNRRP